MVFLARGMVWVWGGTNNSQWREFEKFIISAISFGDHENVTPHTIFIIIFLFIYFFYFTHYFQIFFLRQSAMDAARLSAAKSSPMMETINMVRHH